MAARTKKRSFVETLHVLFAAPDEKGENVQSRGVGDLFRDLLARRDTCCWDYVRTRFPITRWLPGYTPGDLLRDFLAGLAVGFTAIPQSIAYALVAKLPPQYGLYSAIMGPFLYTVFGGSKDVTIGPSAVLSLMTATFIAGHGVEFAILLAFLSGLVIFLVGLLRMGFLIEFISMPVMSGFVSAAAVTITATQLKNLLGYGGHSDDFLESIKNLVSHIYRTSLWDSILGVSTIAILLFARQFKDSNNVATNTNAGCAKRVLSQVLWVLAIGRNAIVVVAGAALALVLHRHGIQPFSLTGAIKSGFPSVQLPSFSTMYNGKEMSFLDMVSVLRIGLVVIPLIAVLESMSVTKAFAKGKHLDVTQELLALGMCNMMGSFLGSMPVTGSFARTAVNNASGVHTPLGGLFTGLLILLALDLLTHFIGFIPQASLAAVIICAMVFMVEYHMIPVLWRTRKLDIIPFFATFIGCLFLSLDYGILVGASLDLSYILYKSARPSLHVKKLKIGSHEIVVVRLEQGLTYPSAEFVRQTILDRCKPEEEGPLPIVVDGTHIYTVDITVARNLQLLREDLEKRNQPVIFWNWRGSAQMICRGLDPEMKHYFRYGSTIQDLFIDNEMERQTFNKRVSFVEEL